MRGIFDGVRVVELASGIAAPYATMFLADHGADVVKVEPPRATPTAAEAGFQTVNRNKRSVVLEPAAPTVTTSGRPAGRRRRGRRPTARAGSTELRALNPGALVVTMPPWGERGPDVADPATPDLVAAAARHLLEPAVLHRGARPAGGAGRRLRHRHARRPGPGRRAVRPRAGRRGPLLRGVLGGRRGRHPAGRDPGRSAPRSRSDPASPPMGGKGRIPCYRLFQAGDGRWFFLACGTPRFFQRLLEVIGRPDLVGDPRLPDPPWGLVDPDALAFIVPILEDAFATRSREAWLAALRAGRHPRPAGADPPGVPAPATSPAANHLEASVEHPELGLVEMMGVPLVMEAAPGEVRRRCAALGEHTAEVRAELAPPARGRAQPARPPATERRPSPDRAPSTWPASSPARSSAATWPCWAATSSRSSRPAATRSGPSGRCSPAWNQGKRSVALDLASRPADQQRPLPPRRGRRTWWWRTSAPGWPPGWAATTPRCARVNPDLVTLSSSGYGDDESMAPVPAFDPLLQALGGIMAAQGGVGPRRRR